MGADQQEQVQAGSGAHPVASRVPDVDRYFTTLPATERPRLERLYGRRSVSSRPVRMRDLLRRGRTRAE